MKVAEPPATDIVEAVHCGGAVYVGEIVTVVEVELEEDGRLVEEVRLDKEDWLVVIGRTGLRVDEEEIVVEVEEEPGIADGWVLVLMLVVIELDVDVVWLLVD